VRRRLLLTLVVTLGLSGCGATASPAVSVFCHSYQDAVGDLTRAARSYADSPEGFRSALAHFTSDRLSSMYAAAPDDALRNAVAQVGGDFAVLQSGHATAGQIAGTVEMIAEESSGDPVVQSCHKHGVEISTR
jgi:hypothetical protein